MAPAAFQMLPVCFYGFLCSLRYSEGSIWKALRNSVENLLWLS